MQHSAEEPLPTTVVNGWQSPLGLLKEENQDLNQLNMFILKALGGSISRLFQSSEIQNKLPIITGIRVGPLCFVKGDFNTSMFILALI